MGDFVKIEDSKNFVRDMNSSAIVNTDTEELKSILAKRSRQIQDADDLENLKNDVKDMKNVLQQILEKLEK